MPEPTVAAESTLVLIDSDSVVTEMLKANDVRRVDLQGLLLLLLRSCYGGGEIVCCQKWCCPCRRWCSTWPTPPIPPPKSELVAETCLVEGLVDLLTIRAQRKLVNLEL